MSTKRTMLARPRGFFSIGIYQPKHEENVGTLWRAAFLYGAASIFTIGTRYQRQASDTPKTQQTIPLYHFDSIDDAVAHLPNGAPLVGIELADRAISLSQFRHPPQATYLLGSEDHGLPRKVIDRCHNLVQVEAAEPWSHNVSATGSIVLWHRHIQRINALAMTA